MIAMTESLIDKVPHLRGEPLYIPFVGAIIEREHEGKKQIMVQIRDKTSDSVYKDVVEIPGGKFRAFEDVYETLKREVKEECGLDIVFVENEEDRKDYENRGDLSSLLNPYCVTQMHGGPFIGLIFKCKATGEPVEKTSETKEARWMDVGELKDLVENNPERVYTAFLAPLKKYTQETK